MGRRPGPDIDKAISELRTQMLNDITTFTAAITTYAQKGTATESLAEIIDSQKSALAAVTTALTDKTPRGDNTADCTRSVDSASVCLNGAITKDCVVEEIDDEYVERLRKGWTNPKDLDRDVSLSLTFFEPSGNVCSVSFTGLSVSVSGIYACLTGVDFNWALLGVGQNLTKRDSAVIRNRTAGLVNELTGLRERAFASTSWLKANKDQTAAIRNDVAAVKNSIAVLNTHA